MTKTTSFHRITPLPADNDFETPWFDMVRVKVEPGINGGKLFGAAMLRALHTVFPDVMTSVDERHPFDDPETVFGVLVNMGGVAMVGALTKDGGSLNDEDASMLAHGLAQLLRDAGKNAEVVAPSPLQA